MLGHHTHQESHYLIVVVMNSLVVLFTYMISRDIYPRHSIHVSVYLYCPPKGCTLKLWDSYQIINLVEVLWISESRAAGSHLVWVVALGDKLVSSPLQNQSLLLLGHLLAHSKHLLDPSNNLLIVCRLNFCSVLSDS